MRVQVGDYYTITMGYSVRAYYQVEAIYLGEKMDYYSGHSPDCVTYAKLKLVKDIWNCKKPAEDFTFADVVVTIEELEQEDVWKKTGAVEVLALL